MFSPGDWEQYYGRIGEYIYITGYSGGFVRLQSKEECFDCIHHLVFQACSSAWLRWWSTKQ